MTPAAADATATPADGAATPADGAAAPADGAAEGTGTVGPVVDGMREAGHWNPMWDGLAELDPEWTEAFMRTTMSTYRGGVLTPQVVELLCIAVDAACTHMYAPGVRRHVRAALDLGVSGREILEVLKLATTVGIHSCNVGVPILMEELADRD